MTVAQIKDSISYCGLLCILCRPDCSCIDKFSEYILRNYENGIVYHRNGHTGDYDLNTEEEILNLLRDGVCSPILKK
jgi:hypothetical protein